MPEEEEIPRNRSVGIVIIIIFILTLYIYKAYESSSILSIQSFWNSIVKDWIDTILFIILIGPLFYLSYLVASYRGEKKRNFTVFCPLLKGCL